jgi:hypothetical protein
MSVFGFGAYAGGLKKTAPDLGRVITDSIKASNQFLVGTSAAISSFNYLKMGRLVLPLAISLGLGSLIGAWGAQELSAGKLDFKSYQGYFGLFVPCSAAGCSTRPPRQAKAENRQRGRQGL